MNRVVPIRVRKVSTLLAAMEMEMASEASQMSPAADQVLQAALGLSESERATVAAKIIESLDPELDDDYTDEEWSAEIARRVEASKAGTAETISWNEAMRSIREVGERAGRRNRDQG